MKQRAGSDYRGGRTMDSMARTLSFNSPERHRASQMDRQPVRRGENRESNVELASPNRLDSAGSAVSLHFTYSLHLIWLPELVASDNHLF
jgi:hypothetical protein